MDIWQVAEPAGQMEESYDLSDGYGYVSLKTVQHH